MDEQQHSIFEFSLTSPYPGLRRFEKHEWPIFFGRETMISVAIERLIDQHLLVVHGDSGCGKSSLIRAGVLPRLEHDNARGGFNWRTVAAEPGDAPLANLARALAGMDGNHADGEWLTKIRRVLNFGKKAPSALVELLNPKDADCICILVDQFEELFAFSRQHGEAQARLYVDFLIGLLENRVPGLYIILTMRSEFLGSCAQFQGFAEAVNQTQYLLPRMAHSDLVRAIREPALIFNGEISMNLASRLIADAGNSQDKLPLIQHGLMLLHREHASGAKEDRTAWYLDVEHFQHPHGLKGMLSDHGDEVMNSILRSYPGDSELAYVIELAFRTLTDIDADGNAVRRPQRLAMLSAVTGTDPSLLSKQLSAFRVDGVSFLRPYGEEYLTATEQLDISHEALIRCWLRISDPDNGWLKREFEDGLIWRSLRVQAEAFERDPDNVLSPATVSERIQWLSERNASWAGRYGGEWAQVNALVDASESAAIESTRQQKELLLAEEREKSHKSKLEAASRLTEEIKAKQTRTWWGLVTAVLLAVLTSGTAHFARVQMLDAQASEEEALAQEKNASEAREYAEAERRDAQTARNEAIAALEELRNQKLIRSNTQEWAAQTVARTSSKREILAQIRGSTDPYELAILSQSLTGHEHLSVFDAQEVISSLQIAVHESTDDGEIDAIVQAFSTIGEFLPVLEISLFLRELLPHLNADKLSQLELLLPIVESLDRDQSLQLFFDLGAEAVQLPGFSTSVQMQNFFGMLVEEARLKPAKLEIVVSEESQIVQAELLRQTLKSMQLLGAGIELLPISIKQTPQISNKLLCTTSLECDAEGAGLISILNNLIYKRDIRSLESPVGESRHYILWIGGQDLVFLPIGPEYFRAELAVPLVPVIPDTKNIDIRNRTVERIQEWLTLNNFPLTINGKFGPDTRSAIEKFQQSRSLPATGNVDSATYSALTYPVRRALTPIPSEGSTLNTMVVSYAEQHLNQRPREVGGSNRGPWVRLYSNGNDGSEWVWGAGFTSFVLLQAASGLGIDAPIRGSASNDTLAAQAYAAGIFISGTDVQDGRYVVKPGDLFLRRRTSSDWISSGIVISQKPSIKENEIVFATIEGNTNDEGTREGYEVARRIRYLTDESPYDFICISSPADDQRCRVESPK